MTPRDPLQPFRVASTLELFFDLVFVIAVSVAASQLHEAFAAGEFAHGVVSYAMLFFAIWWAWMNFAWFATSFDTDDWLYRLTTIVQMMGVLVLAAGVPSAFREHDFTIVVVGYVVMRIAMVAQWLRASRHSGALRSSALRYAFGIGAAQILWVAFLFLPESLRIPAFVVFALVEISIPVVSERSGRTPWHPHHITERYGSFTLIVLGESLLGSANAIIEALHDVDSLVPLISVAVLSVVVTAALWWIYFWPPHHHAISSFGSSLIYGYTHYFVFAAAAAFSVGIELEIDILVGRSEVPSLAASFAVTVPVAAFLVGIWLIAIRRNADRVVNTVLPIGALLVLLDPVIPVPVTLTAGILVVIVVVLVLRPPLEREAAPHPASAG